MEIQEYQIEGTCSVLCSKCEEIYEIEFTGDDSYKSVRDMIKEELLNEGWIGGKCPSCSEENLAEDEDERDSD